MSATIDQARCRESVLSGVEAGASAPEIRIRVLSARAGAFSSEVDTGSLEENAVKQDPSAVA
jgi:hypothetical protein